MKIEGREILCSHLKGWYLIEYDFGDKRKWCKECFDSFDPEEIPNLCTSYDKDWFETEYLPQFQETLKKMKVDPTIKISDYQPTN